MSNYNYSIDSGGHRVATVHVGTVPTVFSSSWVRTDVYFHRYCELDKHPAHVTVTSPSFSCLGRDWTVQLYFNDPNVHVSLKTSRRENILAGMSINSVAYWNSSITVKRSDLRNCLEYGALWIEVRMRMSDSNIHPCTFIPDNSSACRTLQKMFMDKESADVVFEIRGEQTQNNESARETSPTTKFYAHRLILRHVAPLLAELCMTDKSPAVVELPNISPVVFEDLLLYIYGCKKTNFGDDVAHIKEVIEAADKYAVTNLKIDAEAWYTSKTILTLENVLEHLLYADSKNCARLKEAAVDFIFNNRLHTSNMRLLASAPKDVSIEMSASVARSKGGDDGFWSMSICHLRRKAHEKGLDVDGSRYMLISALLESEAENA